MAITTDCTAIAGGRSYGQVAGGAYTVVDWAMAIPLPR
jgi:hypothetical protein